MVFSKEQIHDQQVERIIRHPEFVKSRIAFWRSNISAHLDAKDCEEYRSGKIGYEELKKRILSNNYLDEILEDLTDEQMESLLGLGWHRSRRGGIVK